MNIIYCLVPKTYWEGYQEKDEYFPRDYEQAGFIHATKGDDLLVKVANRVYDSFTGGLLVLVINEDLIVSEVKYEMAKDGLFYPHIYGPLQTSAIHSITPMVRKDNEWAMSDTASWDEQP